MIKQKIDIYAERLIANILKKRPIVKQLFPTLIVDSREFAQLVEYRASFGVAELWQLFDDLRCVHGAHYNLVSAIRQRGGREIIQSAEEWNHGLHG